MLSHADVWRAVDHLAANNHLSPSGLARLAGLDPTTFNKSKRITRDGRQRWPSTESLAKILAVTGTTLGEFVMLIGNSEASALSRKVPVIGLDLAAEEGHFKPDGSPTGAHWDRKSIPEPFQSDVYAIEIPDDRYVPVYKKGDVIAVSPRAELHRDDRVLIKLRDGQILVGRFVHSDPGQLQLGTIVGNGSVRDLDAGDIAWTARILWASQ